MTIRFRLVAPLALALAFPLTLSTSSARAFDLEPDAPFTELTVEVEGTYPVGASPVLFSAATTRATPASAPRS